MGNRAVIAFGPDKTDTIGVYLHWNGGEASIEGFLRAAKALGLRDPLEDSYGVARFVQMVGNYFKGSLSLGIDTLGRLDCDNGDNGLYILGPDWTIAGRRYNNTARREVNEEKTAAICADCIQAFPAKETA